MSKTKDTVELGLQADDICRIIQKCKSAGVTEFSFGGLTLKFSPVGQPVAPPSQEAAVPNSPEAELMNKQSLEDAEDAQMMIDDPFAYERSQMLKDRERNMAHDAGKTREA